MQQFLKKILIYFALLALIDLCCGYCFNFLKRNAKSGDTRKNYYLAEECYDDIIILGSSRAARHYNPKVIEDAYGLSCYNAGEPGCGIITGYARYQLICSNKRPSIVLYEISPQYDYFEGEDNSKYLGRVRQYADRPVIKTMFLDLGDDLEKIRLLSKMYLNNSFIVHNLLDNIKKENENKGYEPLYGEMNEGVSNKPNVTNDPKLDSVKLAYLEKFIQELKQNETKVVFLVSPKYISQNDALLENSDYKPIIELCQNYGILFINHSYMEGISDNYHLFHDRVHLNNDGANAYTKKVCSELMNVFFE